MNQDKLRKFCLLPKFKIEVEKKVNPNGSLHIIYWEWCAPNGVRPTIGTQPKNKVGLWKIFVDVISKDKSVKSYDVNEDDVAWGKLLEEALLIGYKDDDSNSYQCYVDLQNGMLQLIVTRMLTDEGWLPELKIVYSDKDDLFKTTIECGLTSKNDLKNMIDMLTDAEQNM